MKTYLIAHVNPRGSGVAQAKITAQSESKAVFQFEKMYPERTISVIGIEGQE